MAESEPDSVAGVDDFLLLVLEEGLGPPWVVAAAGLLMEAFRFGLRLLPDAAGLLSSFRA